MNDPLPAECGLVSPGKGFAGCHEPPERLSRRRPDIEAGSGAAEVPLSVPAHVALQVVDGVKPLSLYEAFCEAEGEGCIIGPLPGPEAKRPATDHVVDRLKCSGPPELKRRSEGVAGGQAEQAATITVNAVHRYLRCRILCSAPHIGQQDDIAGPITSPDRVEPVYEHFPWSGVCLPMNAGFRGGEALSGSSGTTVVPLTHTPRQLRGKIALSSSICIDEACLRPKALSGSLADHQEKIRKAGSPEVHRPLWADARHEHHHRMSMGRL